MSASQRRPGTAGPQLQAASGRTDAATIQVVQDHLLYEQPPPAWRDGQPAAGYPRSFAHMGGERFATAAGVYLGPELSGTADGNALTHALTTVDPAAYGDLRPAQLFDAEFWTARPAGTTRSDPVTGPPRPGRFDTDTVRGLIRSQPRGSALLATLLTALGGTRRVLFVAEEIEPVLTWIAAATLLLPRRRALEIGFKVFTLDPVACSQRVVAVHPGWGKPAATVDRPGEFVVLDLTTLRCSQTTADPAARAWAELFCSPEPLDLAGAVMLADECGLAPMAALALVRAAVLGQAVDPRHAEAISGWLKTGRSSLIARYGPAIARRLAAQAPHQDLGALRALDAAMASGTLGPGAAEVRLQRLSAELKAARAADATTIAPVGRVLAAEWGTAEAERAAEAVVAELRTAREHAFAAVLLVAGRFRVPITCTGIGRPVDGFVDWWAEHPETGFDPQLWPCPTELDERLRAELCRRIKNTPGDRRKIATAWSAQLAPRQPAREIDAAILGSLMADGTPATRRAVLTEQIGRATRTVAPEVPFGELGRCLWQWTLPTQDELRLFAGAMPSDAGLEPGVVEKFLIDQPQPGGLTVSDLAVVAELVSAGRLQPSPRTEEFLRSNRIVEDAVARLKDAQANKSGVAQTLHQAASAVLQAHARDLVEVLLATETPRVVGDVFRTLPGPAQSDYITGVARMMTGDVAASLIAGAVVVLDESDAERTRQELISALDLWLVRNPSATRRNAVDNALDRRGTGNARALWSGLCGKPDRRGGGWFWRRG
ncbi:GTPase-associated protein 1-related protein [Paractinoplanes lichenicola]|uniref:Uncharacterized protein n=1 Tax=Paractinoplanes lichenicola TaxID=2802976 RepID=A0ABS1W329_9ACTN|nr:GTPase-associated protein 1-related protein [Actinoplanes lichenicola]MBL7261134.1 hypothetical protein [Actinoplanes lichenicola]